MERCELLAPAGGVKQFIAAVENGADAVYVGGRFLNARESAENFDDETMRKAVKFAHLRGVKVYVTMNALVRDDELEEGLEYAKFLYESGVDALIIQDLGLGRYIKRRIPEMELHLSTQASVFDVSGVEEAAELGYSRVVLAREASFDEIKAACSNSTGTEIEVFVHGALCVCWSGQCQLSRSMGGRSGNRGACAQPCRLSYKSVSEDGGVLTEGMPDYPLSPKDLCLVGNIGEMISVGAASLKIEGRMKSPEYVAVVTSIYRKYIDEYYEKGYVEVTEEDRKSLMQVFSRGFTGAYYSGRKGAEMMVEDIPKHAGIEIGKVTGRKDRQLIEADLFDSLEIGDGIEVHSKDITGNIVTYLKEKGEGHYIIGDIKGRVEKGDRVFRTSSKKQLKEAAATYEKLDLEKGTGKRKLPVKMKMTISGKGLMLHAEAPDGTSGECWREIPDPVVQGSSDRFEKALKKTGDTPFAVTEIDIDDEVTKLNMKVSEINEMRRKALDVLRQKIEAACEREPLSYEAPPEVNIPEAAKPKNVDGFWDEKSEKKEKGTIELYFDDWDAFSSFRVSAEVRKLIAESNVTITAVIPMVDVIKNASKLAKVKFKPYISNISKGKEDYFLTSNYDAVLAVARQTGVYAGTLGWIKPLVSDGVSVYADFGLNVYNRETEKALSDLGVKGYVRSLEHENDLSGRYPLMTIEHELRGAGLIDTAGHRFDIIRRDFSSQVLIKKKKTDDMRLEACIASAIKRLGEGSGTVRVYV